MLKFLQDIIDDETSQSTSSRTPAGAAFTRLLLEESYEVSNQALESLRKLPELKTSTKVAGSGTITTGRVTETNAAAPAPPPDGAMRLCCDDLFAVILPNKCKNCKRKEETEKDKEIMGGVKESSSTILSDPTTLSNFNSMADALETLLLHGLNFSSQPTYGTSQVKQCCKGLLAVVTMLAEEEEEDYSKGWVSDNFAAARREERKRRKVCEAEFESHVQTLRRTTRKLRGLAWYERAARKNSTAEASIVLARAWIRCAMSVSCGLSSYCWLLLNSSNRRLVLEGNFAPWSLWRANYAEDAALRNATIILSRMSQVHVVEIPVEGDDVVRRLVNPPSQWWPLPFKSFKARQRFDEEFNPKKKKWEEGSEMGSQGQNPGRADDTRRGGIEDRVLGVGKKLQEEINNTSSIEEGMDKFADIVDQGIAAALNFYNEGKEGVEVAKPLGHAKFSLEEGGRGREGGETGSTTTNAQPHRKEATRLDDSIFCTPIDVLSKSPTVSSCMSTYDPSLAAPMAVLELLSIVERNIDTVGIFHDNVNCMPTKEMMESFAILQRGEGDVKNAGMTATEASALFVHWLRCLPEPMLPCRGALISAMALTDTEERRRNVKLLIEGNVQPPTSIIFVRLLRLLELATSHTHSRRNELTAVRATLLLAPVLVGSGREVGGMRPRGDSNDSRELQDAVEAAEVMKAVLEDVDYYVSGLNSDIENRRERLSARLDSMNFLMAQVNRTFDVRLVREEDDEEERFVEGGAGESGIEDVEIVTEFVKIVGEKGGKGDKAEIGGGAVLEGLNIFNDTKVELEKTRIISLLSLAHFVTNYEKQATSVFGKLSSGLPTVSQISEQFVVMVGKAVGTDGTTNSYNLDRVREDTAPSHFTLLCSEEGAAGSGGGIQGFTVGSVKVYCELTAICWLILQEDFEGGMAKVREGLSATLGEGTTTLKMEDCWKNFVNWKGSWLVKKAEGAESAGEGSLERLVTKGEEQEDGWVRGGVGGKRNATAAKKKKFLKNSRILDERMLKQISKAFPHYVQRREIMKIFDSQTHYQGEDEGLSNFYHSTDGHSYTLLLLKDETGKIFGAFADEQWRDKGNSFYGGKDCFIFDWSQEGSITVYTHKKAKASQKRVGNLFMISNQDFLGMGSGEGGTFALYLDQDLSMGSSSASTTFGNTKPISGVEEFMVENMEVWAFLL